MKILLGTSLYVPHAIGGAERVVELLAGDLVSLGHQVSVITTQPSGPARHAEHDGVSVHYLPVRNLYRPFTGIQPSMLSKMVWRTLDSYNLLMKEAIGRVIDLEKPDVLNTHNIAGLSVAIWAAAHQRGVPIVHTLHDQYLLCHRSTMFKLPKNCVRQCWSCRLLAAPRKHESRFVKAAIGVSQFIVDRHKRFGYFKTCTSTVILNTRLRNPPRLVPPRELAGAFRFGFIGQIIPSKGVRELIEAFRAAPLDGVELWIAGKVDSPYASKLQERCGNDPRIRWLGYVEPGALLGKLDVLVVPSLWHDTAPLVVFEAFAQGVPVLGANRGGIPELVRPQCGWIFEPDTANSLSLALTECFKSSSSIPSMSKACIDTAMDLCKTPWAQRYLQVVRSAMNVSSDASFEKQRKSK